MLFRGSTGMPVADAHDDFLRARRAQVAALAARWVAGGRRRARVPRTLTDAAGAPRGAARLEVIPLKTIVGTVEPTITFDAAFRPASRLVRARWERIALAHRRAVSLPAITEPSERASLLGFNDLLSGATGAGLTLVGGVALTAGGVAALATGALVLVTIPALWILRGRPGATPLQFGSNDPGRRPCTPSSP